MDAHYIGIDVSKDRLDGTRILPANFAVARNGEGLAQLVVRYQAIAPATIAVEATGGRKTVVAAAWRAQPCRSSSSIRRRSATAEGARQTRDDPIDAAVIAASSRRRSPRCASAGRGYAVFADLVARRRQIVEMMAAEGQRERRAAKRLQKHRPAAQGARRNSPNSTPRSTIRCAARRSGPRRKTCSPPSPASDRHRPHADRRNAGTRNARPPSDRSARGAGAVDATVRPVEGQRASSAAVARPCAACCLSSAMVAALTNRPLCQNCDKLVAAGKSNGSPSSPSPSKLLTILNAISGTSPSTRRNPDLRGRSLAAGSVNGTEQVGSWPGVDERQTPTRHPLRGDRSATSRWRNHSTGATGPRRISGFAIGDALPGNTKKNAAAALSATALLPGWQPEPRPKTSTRLSRAPPRGYAMPAAALPTPYCPRSGM